MKIRRFDGKNGERLKKSKKAIDKRCEKEYNRQAPVGKRQMHLVIENWTTRKFQNTKVWEISLKHFEKKKLKRSKKKLEKNSSEKGIKFF